MGLNHEKGAWDLIILFSILNTPLKKKKKVCYLANLRSEERREGKECQY